MEGERDSEGKQQHRGGVMEEEMEGERNSEGKQHRGGVMEGETEGEIYI